jgi:hypothetical protein
MREEVRPAYTEKRIFADRRLQIVKLSSQRFSG